VLVRRSLAIALVVLALGTTACGGSSHPSVAASSSSSSATTTTTAPTTTTLIGDTSFVGNATLPSVAVFTTSDTSAAPAQTLANPNENGAPLVFLVVGPDTGADPVQVYLPVRPNGSTGYVRRADLKITHHQYKVKVEIAAHQITVTRAGEVIDQEPVGIGTSDTPTPGGIFYIKELLQPPDPTGAYGPYAYGLSGFSNVLTSFAGGDGVIGIHGTNQPQLIGTDVSHGCIRMSNAGITKLAAILPLGTPVEIDP